MKCAGRPTRSNHDDDDDDHDGDGDDDDDDDDDDQSRLRQWGCELRIAFWVTNCVLGCELRIANCVLENVIELQIALWLGCKSQIAFTTWSL